MELLQEESHTEQRRAMPDICFGDIQKQVERILGSATFARSPQLSRFLRYCVEKTLLGRPDQLREQILAVEVFRRARDFEARRDPIVRVEARRLRSKLEEYYDTEGRSDPILISLQRGDYVARFAPAWRREQQTKSAERPRILITEDEALVAKDLQSRLKNLGYDVVGSATTGEAAVQLAAQLRPDLVMMDIVLAGRMTGTEAARQIRTQYNIPSVFLTAFSDAVVLEDIKESEPYGYILKPFDPRQMHAVLQLALGRKKREQQSGASDQRRSAALGRALEQAGVCAWEWTLTDEDAGWPAGVNIPEIPSISSEPQTAEAFLDRIVTEDRPAVTEAFRKAIRASGPLEVRYRVKLRDNTISNALALGSVFRTSSGSKHLAGLELSLGSKDGSAAEVDSRLRNLDSYIALTTHDLAEPLRTIGLFAEMLASRQPNDEKSVSLIAQIGSGVERMRSLISDLLAYAMLPETPVKRERTDLNEAVRSALMNLQASVTETGATVRCEPLPDVSGDVTQITQLFQNLLSNSLKYSRTDIPLSIEIGAEQTDDPQHCVVYVRDNGQGFRPEFAEVIFEPFRRLHSRATPGTGIGLAICRRIAEHHGGRIWATADQGQGATFRFTLPCWQAASKSAFDGPGTDQAMAVHASD